MKRILFFALFIACLTNSMMAQDVMVIEKTDNTTERYNVDDIKRVYFEKTQPIGGGVTFNPCTETGERSSTSISGLTSDGVTISVMVSGINFNRLFNYSYTIYISTNRSVSSENYLQKKSGILSSDLIISETFTGLSGNTTYYYVIYFTVSYRYMNRNTYISDVGSFITTNTSEPTFSIETQNTTNITGTTAVVHAHFKIQNAKSKYIIGFFVSKNSIPTQTNSTSYRYEYELSSANYDSTHSVELIDLTPGTTYYVRPYILYDGTYHYDPITSFTTKAYAPTFSVTTKGVTDIKETTAKAEGSIYTNNAVKEYEVGFLVSTNSNPTSTNSTQYSVKKLSENYEKTPFTYAATINNLKQGTKYYVRAYLLYDGTYELGNVLSFTTKSSTPDPEPTTGKLAGHEWVDLGLPSGTKWATCNVGASQPQDYGSYFAWGETSTKAESDYTKKKYKYYDSSTGKYKNIGNDISGTSYDAARSKWGSLWRMPSSQDWSELCIYCTRTIEKIKGRKGMKFTAKNGNSIFIPYAGEIYEGKNGTSIHTVSDVMAWYWLSTIWDATSANADVEVIDDSPSCLDITLYREWGLPVRAIWK